jgi:hypothetical protein
MEKLAAVIFVLGSILVFSGVAVLAVRWARKSSHRAAFLGWGLQFPGAGMDPQPPPQVKLEEAGQHTKLKKVSESGDPEE